MDYKFIVSTIISFGFLLIAYLTYLLKKKDTELKKKEAFIHNQAHTIIINNNFSQLPQEIKENILTIHGSTAGGHVIGTMPNPGKEKETK